MSQNPFRYFKTSPEIIQLAVMMYIRFPLSLRNVEDLLHERRIDICHETVRHWVGRFGTQFAHKSLKRRSERMGQSPQWQLRLDEVSLKIRGKTHYLWRAVDHEGEVLKSFVSKTRDKASALKFMRRAMKRYGNLQIVVPDKLRSYGAAMDEVGTAHRLETGRHFSNRAENSHLPFRRRERAMSRLRRMRSLEKFASIHSSVCNHFNHQRNVENRARFKSLRDPALIEWRELIAA
ncbi:IS6 family transposase [Hyphomonas sp. ND6WE1B]|uniref:IS6 family transposase n=1 Tax=Hyphomonas sp. ND6WE1B TaxID=1848191 RepID=UPI0008076F4A|nr:IS6 family transposase [Hyphomonas sp. ND6WE1B]